MNDTERLALIEETLRRAEKPSRSGAGFYATKGSVTVYTTHLRWLLDRLTEQRTQIHTMREALDHQQARADQAERERDEFQKKHAELEGALCWDTTCLNCASLLEASYAGYVRAEKAEDTLDLVRAALSEHPERHHTESSGGGNHAPAGWAEGTFEGGAQTWPGV